MAKIPILDPDNSETIAAPLAALMLGGPMASDQVGQILTTITGAVGLNPQIAGGVSLLYTLFRVWKKWRVGRKAIKAGAVLLIAGLALSPTYAETKTIREAAAQVQTEREEAPAPQMVVKQRNWFKRHPKTTKGLIIGGIFVAGTVACHNTILGICGHDDRQDTGNSTPVEPAGGGDDCKKNGCHDNDD